MQRYCLDANVFIQAKNGPYGMDVVPAFWDWIDQKAKDGILFSPSLVYQELAAGNDELADWVKARKNTGFFVEPDMAAQLVMQQIADYVSLNYLTPQAQDFLSGADPWVVAQAKVTGAIVVTHEVLVPLTRFVSCVRKNFLKSLLGSR